MSERNALRLSPFYAQASFPRLRGCVKEPTGVESQRRIMSAEEQAGFSYYYERWDGVIRIPEPIGWRAAFHGGGE